MAEFTRLVGRLRLFRMFRMFSLLLARTGFGGPGGFAMLGGSRLGRCGRLRFTRVRIIGSGLRGGISIISSVRSAIVPDIAHRPGISVLLYALPCGILAVMGTGFRTSFSGYGLTGRPARQPAVAFGNALFNCAMNLLLFHQRSLHGIRLGFRCLIDRRLIGWRRGGMLRGLNTFGHAARHAIDGLGCRDKFRCCGLRLAGTRALATLLRQQLGHLGLPRARMAARPRSQSNRQYQESSRDQHIERGEMQQIRQHAHDNASHQQHTCDDATTADRRPTQTTNLGDMLMGHPRPLCLCWPHHSPFRHRRMTVRKPRTAVLINQMQRRRIFVLAAPDHPLHAVSCPCGQPSGDEKYQHRKHNNSADTFIIHNHLE